MKKIPILLLTILMCFNLCACENAQDKAFAEAKRNAEIAEKHNKELKENMEKIDELKKELEELMEK